MLVGVAPGLQLEPAHVGRTQLRNEGLDGVDERLVGARRDHQPKPGQRQRERKRGAHHAACGAPAPARSRAQRTQHACNRQRGAEHADHRGAGGQVPRKRGGQTDQARQASCRPADDELARDCLRIEHADPRRNDEERKHQQYARQRHRTRHHQAEAGIEKEVPPPAAGARGQRHELVAQDPMNGADGQVERHDDRQVAGADGEDVSGEDLLDVLSALRCTVDQQECGGGGHHVDHADQRFLRNAARPLARERQQPGGGKGEGERVGVACAALCRMSQHEGHGRPECGDLGQRQVDEHDVARENLDAEIGVDRNQAYRHQERQPQQGKCVGHDQGAVSALARALTL